MPASSWSKPSAEDLERLAKYIPDESDLDLIILKGHLLIEECLERIVARIVAHGDLLKDARLTFNQKAVCARAMCWTEHENSLWPLIFALNSLRNDLAHQLEPPKFDGKLRRFLSEHAREYTEKPEFKKLIESAPVGLQLRTAVALLIGFLRAYERDARGYRQVVDAMRINLRAIPSES